MRAKHAKRRADKAAGTFFVDEIDQLARLVRRGRQPHHDIKELSALVTALARALKAERAPAGKTDLDIDTALAQVLAELDNEGRTKTE